MKIFRLFALVSFCLFYKNSFSQNSPFFLWGPNLDGSINQKTGIYSDTNNGLLFEAPKDAGGNKLNISFNWRGESVAPRFFIKGSNGYVGVGTTNPNKQFHISGTGDVEQWIEATDDGFASLTLKSNNKKWHWSKRPSSAQDALQLFFQDGLVWSTPYMSVLPNGNVGIGSSYPSSKLSVKGTIHAEEVKVDLNVPAPDYVFEPEYNLLSLQEVETYIQQNKHLPEVPAAEEMEQNGINLSEMNMLLLKKVEELTLYVLEQEKRILKLESDKTN